MIDIHEWWWWFRWGTLSVVASWLLLFRFILMQVKCCRKQKGIVFFWSGWRIKAVVLKYPLHTIESERFIWTDWKGNNNLDDGQGVD